MDHLKKLAPNQLSDSEVVEQVLSGKKELFEILMRRYNQRLFRVVRSYVDYEDDARDIMQDAYIKAYTKLHQFNNEALFSTWLIRIAINEALQHLRKKKRQTTVLGTPEPLEVLYNISDTDQMNPEKQAMNNETSELLKKAVDRLPEKYKVVYVLHQLEGLTNQEISDCLQLSDSNVKVRLHRAKKQLKDELFVSTHDASIFEFGNKKCDLMVETVMEKIMSM